MKLVCAQCGQPFELTASEVSYYVNNDMPLPTRCKNCRGEKKAAPKGGIEFKAPGGDENSFDISQVKTKAIHYHRIDPKKLTIVLLCFAAVVLVVCCILFNAAQSGVKDSNARLAFADEKVLYENYTSYGYEMGYSNAEEYEDGANAVITNESVETKQASTGNTLYYIRSTNELVEVSADGKIVSFSKPKSGQFAFDGQ